MKNVNSNTGSSGANAENADTQALESGTDPASIRVHQVLGLAPGPQVLVLGAVHGNEICGTRAIERVLREIDDGSLKIERGSVTFIPVTNPLAYALKQRMGERNLNRNMRVMDTPQDFEDRIAAVLCPLLDKHDALLDLHSFHTPGIPFALVGPLNNSGTLEPFTRAEEESRLVAHLGPRRIVEGWMETYAKGVQRRRAALMEGGSLQADESYGIGTTEYIRARGGYGVTLECGQHDDPQAPEVAYHAIQQTLALLGLIDRAPQPPAPDFEVLKLVDVIDREHADDQFVKPWTSFDPVSAGEVIGLRQNGSAVQAPADGFVVFPNPKALPGNEWFYFAQPSSRRMV
ncbi:MAG: succinylglutamate desuccinylase/aspartoacylase family protein [Burkholderiales bacterium]|jgi:succinylglutamate desuccinylase|nr:succinylglutamate desuccinylase/aspartoacylase family protein [Burkholderiales bacterium]MCA3157642.1 succinylglutamate desuccinylase/aspartoacylase family protein [Burkholderiales bacterium]MCA3167901.1 succinylglutamate desuccinylase/aspartoacylase family protein [Burkholderiales bacterium]